MLCCEFGFCNVFYKCKVMESCPRSGSLGLVRWEDRLKDYLSGGEPKSLILWGPSLDGVKLWVQTLGKYIYIEEFLGPRGDIEYPTDRVDFGIIDDTVGAEDLFQRPRWGTSVLDQFRLWLSCEPEITISEPLQLVHESSSVKWGKPVVLLTHDDLLRGASSGGREWLLSKCDFVRVRG
jgi:hypothetical protein